MKITPRKYNWFDSIRIPFQSNPLATSISIITVFTACIMPTIQIFVTALFIDRALSFANRAVTLKTLVLPIVLLALLVVFEKINSVITNILKQKIGNDLRSKYIIGLTTKRAMLNYSEIENHNTQDVIKRVCNKADESVQLGLSTILSLFGILLKSIGFLVVLTSYVWWAGIIIVLIAIPIILTGLKGGKEQYEAQREFTNFQRRHEYLSDVLTNREAVDERSLFGYKNKLVNMWNLFYKKARKIEFNATIKSMTKMKIVSSITSLITLAVGIILLFPVSKSTLTVGLYIGLIQASNNIISMMSWELSDNIKFLSKVKEYFKDLTEFANLSETKGATDIPTKFIKLNKIEFKNVTFSYPKTEHTVLKNLSFIIEEGRHYAIVGANGAGKTTITKLITGLYTEFDGEILINNKSIRDYDLSELKSLTSVLFQDFSKYYITLKDNIGIGNIADFGTAEQEKRIKEATEKIGLDHVIKNFSQGLETSLGKLDENGQDLSGGEWQRVAMARTIISNAPFRILDEPTAALDPISESKLYTEFEQISKGWTTLFISHRLGSTKLADEILVLENGKITQKGTHSQLMEEKGIYFEMYESQRSWYN